MLKGPHVNEPIDTRAGENFLITSSPHFQVELAHLLTLPAGDDSVSDLLATKEASYLRAMARSLAVLGAAVVRTRVPCMDGPIYWFTAHDVLSFVAPELMAPAWLTCARLVTAADAATHSTDDFADATWHDLWQTLPADARAPTVHYLLELCRVPQEVSS